MNRRDLYEYTVEHALPPTVRPAYQVQGHSCPWEVAWTGLCLGEQDNYDLGILIEQIAKELAEQNPNQAERLYWLAKSVKAGEARISSTKKVCWEQGASHEFYKQCRKIDDRKENERSGTP
jgi:hypothetical protein